MDKEVLIKKEIKDCKLYLNELYDSLRNSNDVKENTILQTEISVVESTRDKLILLLDEYTKGLGDSKLEELTKETEEDFDKFLLFGHSIPEDKKEEYLKVRNLKESLDTVNEKYLSKVEIYEYLNDYKEVMKLARNNFFVPLGEVFETYMISTNQGHKNNSFYYYNMIKLHILFVNASILSVVKDEDFEYLMALDPELSEKTKTGDLAFFKDKFIIPTDYSRFKKTHVFNFVRNAFFHSDTNELYKINPNCNYVNISLKKTNPIPFNIKITANDIFRLTNAVQKYSHHISAFELRNQDQIVVDNLFKSYVEFSQEIDKTKLIRKVLPDGIVSRKEDIVKDIEVNKDFFSITNFDNTLNKYGAFTEIDYSFSEEQKKLLYNKFNYFNTILSSFDMKFFVVPIVFNYMPCGINKLNFLFFESAMSYTYLFNPNNSIYDIASDICTDYTTLFEGKQIAQNKKTIFNFVSSDIDLNRYGFLYLFDDAEKNNLDDVLLFKYVFGTMNNEEKISIGGVEYDSEVIRNAFTHNRFRGFIDSNNNRCFYLYDDENLLVDPDNAYWSATFSYNDLKASADCCIVQNYSNNMNNKTKKK